MYTSEVFVHPPRWAAQIIDEDGNVPGREFDETIWAADMKIAAHLLAAMGLGPRCMVMVHPDDYGSLQ